MKYVLYHDNCMDGFCSALAFWLKFKNDAEYIPVNYSKGFPENLENNSNYYIVDFSYSRPILEKLAKNNNVIVLDHHISAKNQLQDLPYAHFNMNKSGCVLSWEFLFPDKKIPPLFKYVQDRDLWIWELPNSEAISEFLFYTDRSFDHFNYLIDNWGNVYEQIVDTGNKLLKKDKLFIEKSLKNCWVGVLNGKRAVFTISPPSIASKLGQAMMKKFNCNCACIITSITDGIVSLRSRLDVDVSKIAQEYGGGGHKYAAGFVNKKFVFQTLSNLK